MTISWDGVVVRGKKTVKGHVRPSGFTLMEAMLWGSGFRMGSSCPNGLPALPPTVKAVIALNQAGWVYGTCRCRTRARGMRFTTALCVVVQRYSTGCP
jgi:hypothetical protein